MSQDKRNCDECESEYFKDSSEMISLCPDCAHKLYRYPNCKHHFDKGECINCGWNGKTSKYLKK